MTTQIPFSLPVEPALGADDFMVTPGNEAAVKRLNEKHIGALLLLGGKGSGKSHLASIWQHKNAAATVNATTTIATQNMLWEDADKTAWNPPAQERAFHLLNSAREGGYSLLITASQPPALWPLTLADVRSRLLALPVALLEAPDDTLVAGLLLKHLSDRQLKLSEETLNYLVPRLPRDGGAIADIVKQLDALALTQKRAITIPLIKESGLFRESD